MHIPMESARRATGDDIPAMEAIADRLREAIVDQRGGAMFLQREAGPWPDRDRLAEAVEGRSAAAVAGCYDGIVFGYAIVAYEELLDGTTLARLTDFVVDEEIRGSGIGEAMMNLILELAEDRGCIGIDSVALPGDRSTKNFFESFGLKARLLTVHRAFDVDGAG
ncbi:MAG: GNAT family N-acetyltransferase [Actinomycetota bacterium]